MELYSRSTLKKLSRAVRAGCAVRSASLRQQVSETGSCGYGIAGAPSADVTLMLQDASQRDVFWACFEYRATPEPQNEPRESSRKTL